MKSKLLKVVNICLLLLGINQFLSGFFPQWYGPWGGGAHQFGAFGFLAGVGVHLVLNWKWIQGAYGVKRKGP